MKPHPAAAVFPPLEGADLEALTRDIEQNGQLEPIVVHDETILDGNSRFAACLALGIGSPPMRSDCGWRTAGDASRTRSRSSSRAT